MVKLSKRMSAVAAMVTSTGVLADVGTDHGYLPIALVGTGKVSSAIALDVNPGPLARARDNIAANGLQNYIDTRLSDGLASVCPGEAQTILIAGMGGDLMIRILENGNAVCRRAEELILQPQSDIGRVREYLARHNFLIVDENMVFEDGKYYPMMRVLDRAAATTESEGRAEENARICNLYGPFLLKNRNPVLKLFLEREHCHLTRILEQLKKQGDSDKVVLRIEEIQSALRDNESAHTFMEEGEDAGF